MDYPGDRRGRDSRREDYSDTGTAKRSNYPKSRESASKRPNEGRARKFDNKGGPPLSRSALTHGFAKPDTAKPAPSTIASISSKNHKSATVVGDEEYERDMRYGINDERTREAAVEKARKDLERRQGSLPKEERDKVLSNWTQETVDRTVAGPPRSRSQAPSTRTPSQAPSARTHASRATENTRVTQGTRQSRTQTRAESVDPSGRGSQSTRLRSESAAPPGRNPVQRGASFSMSTSTTLMTNDANNGATFYNQKQHLSYHSSGNGSSRSKMVQTISLGSRSGDITDSKYRPSRGGEVPKMVDGYPQAGIPRVHPGYTMGGDPARHRPFTLPPPKSSSDSRIEELGSVRASDASGSTLIPLRRKKKLPGDEIFDNSQSGAKTITPSEASRFERDAASRSEYTERSGHPSDLRSTYSIREPRRTEPSVAASRNSQSTLGPPPSLNNYRGHRAPSTTRSYTRRLAEDGDLAVESYRYGR